MHRTIRRIATTVAGAAAITAIAAAPGMASTKSLTIDGVAHPVSALKAKTGKLYVASPEQDQLVAFTKKAAFRKYVKKSLNLRLSTKRLKTVAPAKTKAQAKAKARASWAGDYATFYEHHNGYGQGFHINSGYQEPDLGRVGCFLWFCKNWNNLISSVRTHGTSAVLYDNEGFYGSVYVVGPNQLNNIPSWFNDRASSAYSAWSW